MTKDDALILKSVLLYILTHTVQQEKKDIYSIVKTAYFAQQIHLASYGAPIYNSQICALPFGPVPSHIYDILKLSRGDMQRVHCFHSNEENGFLDDVANTIAFDNEIFSAKENPDMDYLSVSDIEALDQAIAKVSELDFNGIMSETHRSEWERAKNTQSKELDIIEIAREGGANSDTLEYIRSNMELSKATSQWN